MTNKINMVMMALMVVLIASMWIAFMQFIAVRSELARVEAEGISSCYMINCTSTPFGRVECFTQHVPEVNVSGWGFDGTFEITGT